MALVLACDAGTTTIDCAVVEVPSLRFLRRASARNEQSEYGADVVSRMEAASTDENAALDLSTLLRQSIARAAEKAASNAGGSLEDVTEAVVAGNPAVLAHLVGGQDLEALAPGADLEGLLSPPYDLGMRADIIVDGGLVGLSPIPRARILAPLRSYVGSDTACILLWTRMGLETQTALAIDLGTNGEVALSHGRDVYVTSTAAGPAFEGTHLGSGAEAAPGAITSVEFEMCGKNPIVARMEVIAGTEPIGFCGSGVIDALAGMLEMGIIDQAGRLSAGAGRLNGTRSAVSKGYGFYGELAIDQSDISAAQLAKAAISAGTRVLMEHCRVRADDLTKVYLCGRFGEAVNVCSATKIGLLPPVNPEVVFSFPDAVLTGAALAATSQGSDDLARVRSRVTHIPLSGNRRFQSYYLRELLFPSVEEPGCARTRGERVTLGEGDAGEQEESA